MATAKPTAYPAHDPFYSPAGIAARDLPVEANPVSPIDLAMMMVPGSPLAKAMGMAARSAPLEASFLSRAAIGGGRAAVTAGLTNDVASGRNPLPAVPLNYGAGFGLGLGAGALVPTVGSIPLWTRTEPLGQAAVAGNEVGAALTGVGRQARLVGRAARALPSGPSRVFPGLPGPPRPSGLIEDVTPRPELRGSRVDRRDRMGFVVPTGGPFFHGTKEMFDYLDAGAPGEWGAHSINLIGPGLYTTNGPMVSSGYSGDADFTTYSYGRVPKSRGVYAVFERPGARLHDLEQVGFGDDDFSSSLRDAIEASGSLDEDAQQYLLRHMFEQENASGDPTDMAAYRHALKVAAEDGAESYQDVSQRLIENMVQRGYSGLQHLGGKYVGGRGDHTVRVYWHPQADTRLVPFWSPLAQSSFFDSAARDRLRWRQDFGDYAGDVRSDLMEAMRRFYNSGRSPQELAR